MINEHISIEAVCESSIIVRFSNEINDELPLFISQVCELIYARHSDSIMNLTPSYTTLLIDYLPYRTGESEMLNALAETIHQVDQQSEVHATETITLPVYYDVSVAPDLSAMLENKSMKLEELIERHTDPLYTICAIGFAPGFAFLSGLDERLKQPRLATPRLSVQAGSVGIADNQTAVYPSVTPGGWNIIGNCPLPLFDPHSESLSPFRVGDKVRFESIGRTEYLQSGGQLWEN